MGKFKKYCLPFLLLGILVLAVACTNSEETGQSSKGSDKESQGKSEGEKNVRTVLETIFTGPNEEQVKLLNSNGDIEKFSENLNDYRQENFKPYMSTNFYDSHILKLSGGIGFLHIAHPAYILEVDEMTLEEREAKEGDYDFIVKVSYTNKESGKSETMNVEGTASTNEDGKITSIRYLNAEEFRDAIRNHG
ncbi:hypothetical protein [Alkalihalobacillus sp. R86527]|uniref:hypothetical protein n=1 Tax=Alkalihalobacillus sp. R86527 TaxID=3093863 RepID=UPI00366AE5AC